MFWKTTSNYFATGSFIIVSSQVSIKLHSKNLFPSLLSFKRAMKKTLEMGFGRRPIINFNFFFNILLRQVKIKLNTKILLHSMLSYGDSYEEDLKIVILKTTSDSFYFFLQFSFQLGQYQVIYPKSASLLAVLILSRLGGWVAG